MNLEEKVLAIEEVFLELDQEIKAFKDWSRIGCESGCGKCCFKPDIEATILEFIPFAYFLHHNNLAADWLTKAESTTSSTCIILNPGQLGTGLCTQYKHRGMICRLFGFSARVNKHGLKELVTCDPIKKGQPERYQEAYRKIGSNEAAVPLIRNYYLKLHGIDMDLARNYYPINVAIRKAIETVLAYYAYRNN